MDHLEKITEKLSSINNGLLDIQNSIDNIQTSKFYEDKNIYSLFPDFIQDFSLYSNFDWISIDAEVVRSDRFGATVVLYRRNIFKREIIYPLFSRSLEVHYLSCHKDKSALITFKDLEINEVEEVKIAELPPSVALEILKESLSVKELKILIETVKKEITEAEREYDLNKAAELRYGILTILHTMIEASGKQKKNE